MSKSIAILMIAVVCALSAAPAFAEPVTPTPISQEEAATLALQETQAIDSVGQVAAGRDTITLLAAVGVVFIVLIIAAAIS